MFIRSKSRPRRSMMRRPVVFAAMLMVTAFFAHSIITDALYPAPAIDRITHEEEVILLPTTGHDTKVLRVTQFNNGRFFIDDDAAGDLYFQFGIFIMILLFGFFQNRRKRFGGT